MGNFRLWVSLDKDIIVFARDYRDPETWNHYSQKREYTATPSRIMRVLNASNKYTHYKG